MCRAGGQRKHPPWIEAVRRHEHRNLSGGGALEICAARTNGNWQLTRPIIYPAQTTAIEVLLGALQQLVPATRISAAELSEHQAADAEYRF